MARIVRILLIMGIAGAAFFWMTNDAHAAECFEMAGNVGTVCTGEETEPTYVTPEPRANSFLPDEMYVRLKDLINVYPEPDASLPPVRNVGDGYLFSTVQAVVEANGELWYNINYGEYVRASEATVADVSEFAGVEVKKQPERPFGWMIVDFWYSLAPGAEPPPNALKLPRYTLFQVYDAVEADDGWIWYNIGGGRWMRQTYVSLIEPKQRPAEIGPDEYWVEVDLYEQSFAAYEGDQMVYAGLVSSGLNRWPTNEGLFQVWDRWEKTKMSGAEGKIDYYFIEDVPHTMYFDYDIALHGAFWHDRFGYKHSHGCVNMPPLAAEWIFYWSENAPNDLWVWVHESDPYHYFERYDPLETFAGP